MSTSYDIIVIGAGVIGLSCAYSLARERLRVLLVDDGGPSATAAAAGMICPSFEHSHDAGKPELALLFARAGKAWDGFARELSDNPGAELGYRRTGAYGIGYHARPEGSLVPKADALPAFSSRPSFFAAEEGSVEPMLLAGCLRRRFADRGGEELRARARLVPGGVEAEGERYAAHSVVLATGAAREHGPSSMTAVEGEAFVVALETPSDVPTVVRSPTTYFVPRTDGSLYIGATENWPGAIPQHRDELWREALRLLPGLGDARLLRHLKGLRPFVSRDGPLVARDGERPDLIRAQGHYRNGVLLAPVAARQVRDLVLG